MNMKNLLQALSDIEPPKVEDKKRLIQEGTGPGQILNVQMEELDSASLRYLSGVRKTIEECGMAPMSPPAPRPPATINITAADSHELGSLLKTMANLADHGHDKMNEPVYRADPSPVYHDSNLDMKGMVKLIDDGEIEEEIIQDGMNDDVPVYDNSPDRQTKEGDWPLNGDMDNNEVANGDAIVNRNKMDIAEQLMAEYRVFVAEESEKAKAKRRAEMQRAVDANQVEREREREKAVEDLEKLILHARGQLENAEKSENVKDIEKYKAKIKSLEAKLNLKKAEKSEFGPKKVKADESLLKPKKKKLNPELPKKFM